MNTRSNSSRVLITDAYTWYNKGDAAIVVGILKTIRRLFPSWDVTVLSATPEIDRRFYCRWNAKVRSRLFNTRGYSSTKRVFSAPFFVLLGLLYLMTTRLGDLRLPGREILAEYRRADLVISCGGGFLGGRKFGSALVNLVPLYYAKSLGKRVVIFGQSIEPFRSKLLMLLTRFILDRVDFVFVRERYSLEVLKRMGVKAPYGMMADAAFVIDSRADFGVESYLGSGKLIERPMLGITVRNWEFPGRNDRKTRLKQYLESVSALIEWWVESKNGSVVIFPQVVFAPKDDDRTISSTLYNSLRPGSRNRSILLVEDFNPEELKTLIGEMDVFVGTRMHSNIFALSGCVPTVAIAYEMKTTGIMEMLGMKEFVIDISNLTGQGLIDLCQKVYERELDISEALSRAIPRLAETVSQALCRVGDQFMERNSGTHVPDSLPGLLATADHS